MRVVALIPGGISDQLLFFPTLDDLKQSYPDLDIDVVVEPRSKAAYRVSKSVNEVVLFDFQDRNSPADWANLLGIIRDRYYDVAISASPGWAVGFLLWLSGVAMRVGYGSKLFLTNPVPFKPNQYQALTYHDLLQGMGISSACPELAISIPKGDLDWADAEQKRQGIGSYVLIYLGTAESEPYPLNSWQQIVQDFQQRQPDLSVVVTGDDPQVVTTLAQACPTVKVIKPGDIGKLAAIIAGANLVLTPNSLALHLAVALKVYTLALFGKADPAKLLPDNEKFLALKAPSGNIADISPQQVLTKVWGG